MLVAVRQKSEMNRRNIRHHLAAKIQSNYGQPSVEALSKNNGLLIVDPGHNKGISGEAAHPWNTLNSLLTYHQIHACKSRSYIQRFAADEKAPFDGV